MPDAAESSAATPSAASAVSDGKGRSDATHGGSGAAERRRLLSRAGIIGAGTLASRVLGLMRDVVLAALFDRDATDAWWVAFTIPNALRQLLGEGAVSGAVVPVLADKLAREGDAPARRFFARVRGASLISLAVVSVCGVIFARPITELFAGGYRDRPAELERTVELTRIVFPYIAFMGTAALGMAALNAKRKFAVAAFAPGLLNVALIAAAFALPPVLRDAGRDAVLALAIGALLGGALQVLAQWPALRAIGFADPPQLVFDADVRRVLRRLGPMTLGIGIYAIDLVLARRFLSGLGSGAQSYFAWAMRLCDFPQGVFVMALSTAALPSLATLAAEGQRAELATTWAHGMNLAMFVAIPTSVLFAALGEPIVVAIFQRGAFDAQASHETARALLWQGAGIWTVAATRQIVPAFYALGDTRTPVVVSAIDLCAFIGLAVGLRGPMGHEGISVAVSGSSAVQMALLLVGLKLRMGTVRSAVVVPSMLRVGAASAVAAVAGWAAARVVDAGSSAGPLARTLPGVVGVAAYGGVFLLVAWGLRAPELDEILGAFRRRLRGRAAAGAGARKAGR
jgi:putative peptidoglycan lipid II flippase